MTYKTSLADKINAKGRSSANTLWGKARYKIWKHTVIIKSGRQAHKPMFAMDLLLPLKWQRDKFLP